MGGRRHSASRPAGPTPPDLPLPKAVRRGRMMSEEIGPIEGRRSAIHEAGHAIAAVLLDLGSRDVSIGKRSLPGGMLIGGDSRWAGVASGDLAGKGDMAIPPMTPYLSGPAAESRISPRPPDPDVSDDFHRAPEMAEYAAGEVTDLGQGHSRVATTTPAKMAICTKGRGASGTLVDEHWPTIEALADLLQARRTMTGQEVSAFVRDRDRPDQGV